MYLLSKSEIISSKLCEEIKNILMKKLSISINDCVLIKNPLHLNYGKNINFKEYNSLYVMTNNMDIKKNENLSKLLKTKSNEEIKTLLINDCRDKSFSNQFIKGILDNEKFIVEDLDVLIKSLSNLLNEIYYEGKTPTDVILEKKKILGSKSSRDFIEDMSLFILKNRATRFSIISIIDKLKEIKYLSSFFKGGKVNANMLDILIKDCGCKIIFTTNQFNTIYDKYNHKKSRYINNADSYTTLYFENMENIIEKFNKCYLETKYIYLEKNNIILKEINYLELIQLTSGIEGFKTILSVFDKNNLNKDFVSNDFIEYLSEKNLTDISKTLIKDFDIKSDKLDALSDKSLSSYGNKRISVLDMINRRYMQA